MKSIPSAAHFFHRHQESRTVSPPCRFCASLSQVVSLTLALAAVAPRGSAQESSLEPVIWNWANEVVNAPLLPWWNQPRCWLPQRIPGPGDEALVTGDCDYWEPIPFREVGALVVAGFGLRGPTLTQSRGLLSVGSVTIGGTATRGPHGHYLHTGGNLVTHRLWMDAGISDEWATYEISGLAQLSGYSMIPSLDLSVGRQGKARFGQQGGTVKAANITLGEEIGGVGFYLISGGSAETNFLDVGGYGLGLLDASGGRFTVLNRTQVGVNNPGRLDLRGSAEFDSGSGDLDIAVRKDAIMTQKGNATLKVLNLTIGQGALGTYEFSDGRIDASNIYLGQFGEGRMVQSDGELVVYGVMKIGNHRDARSHAPGRFEWRGGLLSARIVMDPPGIFALARSFPVKDLNSIQGPEFFGSIAGLEQATFEVTNRSTAFVQAGDRFAVGNLLLGSVAGPGRLSLKRGRVEVSSRLALQPVAGATGAETYTGIHTVVAGTAAGSDYGQIFGGVGANADLAGTLVVEFSDRFAPKAGDRFDLVTGFDGRTRGQFANVAFYGLGGEFAYDLSYEDGGVTLFALSDAMPGGTRLESAFVRPDGIVSLNGGSREVGGVDIKFVHPPTEGGTIKARIGKVPREYPGLVLPPVPEELIPEGMKEIQYWDLSPQGALAGPAELVFAYDDSTLAQNRVPESLLTVYHFNANSGAWEQLDTLARDPALNTLKVVTNGFSPFIIGTVRTGKATGGGWIATASKQVSGVPAKQGSTRANFGFVAQRTPDGVRVTGHLQYSTAGLNLESTLLDQLRIDSAIKACFEGEARVNGRPGGRFTVSLEDHGEPGREDQFSIKVVSNAGDILHQASGPLGGGSIQIRLR